MSCGGDGGSPILTAPGLPARAQRLTGISLVVPQTVLRVGQSVGPLVVRGTYDDGPSATVEAVWTSTNPRVLTVDESGLVTGAGVGTASVTATFGPWRAEAVFQVVAGPD
ncbi:MAG: Ig-like domain-containing protein [Acidobacteria bacterium]|nr:Ig-like domain-containing protein [Acidobacteriota bacterium]